MRPPTPTPSFATWRPILLSFSPSQLHERLIALDDLDAGFEGIGFGGAHEITDSAMISVRRHSGPDSKLANAEIYQSIRSEIVRGSQPRTLLQWLLPWLQPSEPERIRKPLAWLGLRLPRRVGERSSSAPRTERTEPSAITGDGALSADARATYSPPDSSHRACGR